MCSSSNNPFGWCVSRYGDRDPADAGGHVRCDDDAAGTDDHRVFTDYDDC